MNRFSKIFLVALLVLVGLFLIYPSVNAAGLVPCGRSSGTPEEMKPCTICDIFALGSRIINFVLFTVVPAIAVLFYLLGGLMILLGGARPALIAQGKTWFWNTTIGLFIIFGAWMLTNTILKSLAGDSDYSKSWFTIECTSAGQQPPSGTTPTPTSGGTATPTPTPTPGGAQCPFSGVNLCQGQTPPGGCSNANCSQYAASINKNASGAATANLLKSILFTESSCNISAATASSYGLMQLQPATANIYRTRCSVQVDVTSSWLTNPANAEKSICIAAQYVNFIAQSRCGSSPRNIYAGYNGGTGANGACGESESCKGDKNCDNQTVMRWECLYDDMLTPTHTQHTVCNTGYNETKSGTRKVVYCLNNPGF